MVIRVVARAHKTSGVHALRIEQTELRIAKTSYGQRTLRTSGSGGFQTAANVSRRADERPIGDE